MAFYFFFWRFALIFNDIFAAIGVYFVENIVLNTIDRVLHLSLFILFISLYFTRKRLDNLEIDYQPD
jgi:hypothetical protein